MLVNLFRHLAIWERSHLLCTVCPNMCSGNDGGCLPNPLPLTDNMTFGLENKYGGRPLGPSASLKLSFSLKTQFESQIADTGRNVSLSPKVSGECTLRQSAQSNSIRLLARTQRSRQTPFQNPSSTMHGRATRKTKYKLGWPTGTKNKPTAKNVGRPPQKWTATNDVEG